MQDLEDFLMRNLKDRKLAAAYLTESLQQYMQRKVKGDYSLFLLAVSHVLQSQGGIPSIKEKLGMDHHNVYRVFTSRKNCEWKTFIDVLHAMGFKLQIQLQ